MYLNTSSLIQWQRRRHASALEGAVIVELIPSGIYQVHVCTYICQTRLLLAEDADIGEQRCNTYD